MNEKKFLLNEYLTTGRPGYIEHSRKAEIALIFCEGMHCSRGLLYPKSLSEKSSQREINSSI